MSDAPNPFDDWTVDAKTMMILLNHAGWGGDYWGKFYGPDGIKCRDPRDVLHWVRTLWKCPRCECDPGCPCCNPFDCADDGNPYADPHVPWRRERAENALRRDRVR